MEEFLRKALYVEDIDEDVDLESAPSTGQEYLKRVIMEARKCEPVVVANIDARKLKAQTIRYSSDSGCPPAPKEFIPTLEWQQHQVSNFSEIRSKLSQFSARVKQGGEDVPSLPPLEKEEEWSSFCFGKMGNDGNIISGTPPLLPIILSMNQFKVETLLEYHVHWIEESPPLFSQERGQWLFSLLTKLEKPLKPEMCSLIRTLARLCATLRSRLPSAEDALLPQLNLFICLVGRYFDQTDLADASNN